MLSPYRQLLPLALVLCHRYSIPLPCPFAPSPGSVPFTLAPNSDTRTATAAAAAAIQHEVCPSRSTPHRSAHTHHRGVIGWATPAPIRATDAQTTSQRRCRTECRTRPTSRSRPPSRAFPLFSPGRVLVDPATRQRGEAHCCTCRPIRTRHDTLTRESARRTLILPTALTIPADSWTTGYAKIARTVPGLPDHARNIDGALRSVGACLDPLLGGHLDSGSWDPAAASWTRP